MIYTILISSIGCWLKRFPTSTDQNIASMLPIPVICLMECTHHTPNRGKDKNESCWDSSQLHETKRKKKKFIAWHKNSLIRVSYQIGPFSLPKPH